MSLSVRSDSLSSSLSFPSVHSETDSNGSRSSEVIFPKTMVMQSRSPSPFSQVANPKSIVPIQQIQNEALQLMVSKANQSSAWMHILLDKTAGSKSVAAQAFQLAALDADSIPLLEDLVRNRDLNDLLSRNYGLLAAAGTGDSQWMGEILSHGLITDSFKKQAFLSSIEKDFVECSSQLIDGIPQETLDQAIRIAAQNLNVETMNLLVVNGKISQSALDRAAALLIESKIRNSNPLVIACGEQLLKRNLSPAIQSQLVEHLERLKGKGAPVLPLSENSVEAPLPIDVSQELMDAVQKNDASAIQVLFDTANVSDALCARATLTAMELGHLESAGLLMDLSQAKVIR